MLGTHTSKEWSPELKCPPRRRVAQESFIVRRHAEFFAQSHNMGIDLESRNRCRRQAPIAELGKRAASKPENQYVRRGCGLNSRKAIILRV
jgi:hypothetical protein